MAVYKIQWKKALSRFGYLLKVDTSDHHDFLMVVSKIKMLEGNHPFPCDRYKGFSGVAFKSWCHAHLCLVHRT